MAALGTPSGTGIPIAINVEVGPQIHLGYCGNQLVLTWPLSSTGYTLESSSTMLPGSWTAVTGVANNSVVVSTATGNSFFRLKK